MNFLEIPNYYLYDFAEHILGYSLKGSGRMIKLEEYPENQEKILKIKRYYVNRCDKNEFVFTSNSCIRVRSYWSNQDLTKEFEDFYEESISFTR